MARRCISLLLVLVFVACKDEPQVSIFGEWVIAEYRPSDRSAMTRSEADQFRGLQLSYSPVRASILERTCDKPTYRRWTLSPRHFESDYGVAPKQVGIQADSIEVVHVDCSIDRRPVESEILILAPDRVILTIGGVFFLMTRVGT